MLSNVCVVRLKDFILGGTKKYLRTTALEQGVETALHEPHVTHEVKLHGRPMDVTCDFWPLVDHSPQIDFLF